MPALRLAARLLPILCLSLLTRAFAQPCTTLGQTPSTAFPVCGTSTFTQSTVPICSTNDLFVPGCSGSGNADYENKNPFFYKFTCYTSGTLGFIISPLAANEDYDWQLYDITGRNPNDIFTDNTLVVTGNWAGTYGNTGASATGTTGIQCASQPSENRPTFARMPNIIQGHEYLLLVSHFTDGQSGYTLNFTGGTAVITDPTEPHLLSVKPDCDGKTIRLKVNKKMKCNSLTPTGSEFSILPAAANVIAAATTTCTNSFDFDEIIITLDANLPNDNYRLIINNGTDGNSLLDNCGRNLPVEELPFFYAIPRPIFADSVGKPGCAPTEVKVYFPKRIACNSLAADGSDFAVTGPAPVTVSGVSAACTGGLSDIITVKFAAPVVNKGTYNLVLKAGTDGSTIIDECNLEMPQHSRAFTAVDTVSAEFDLTAELGCRFDTLHFSHNGAHDVNKWTWTFNNTTDIATPSHTMIVSATSTTQVKLIVTNGICSDTVNRPVVMDNEVIAGFDMPAVICPEDPFLVTDTSKGLIDIWQWNFGNVTASTLKEPGPVQFPQNNIESYYNIRLRVTNIALGCTDSVIKKLRVLNNCFIAVPTGFTPNGDGVNDYLYPNNAVKARDLQFKVYNRWGQLVFSTSNWQEKWDGTIGGIPQAPGVFVWFLRYTHITTGQKVFQKGTTTLIR